MEFLKKFIDVKDLFLKALLYQGDDSLRVIVVEGITSSKSETLEIGTAKLEGVKMIEVTNESRTFNLVFNSVITMKVSNEIYEPCINSDVYQGKLVRLYKHSLYLNKVLKEMNIDEMSFIHNEKAIMHIGVYTCNQTIDVITTSPPVVTEEKAQNFLI